MAATGALCTDALHEGSFWLISIPICSDCSSDLSEHMCLQLYLKKEHTFFYITPDVDGGLCRAVLGRVS